MKTTATERPARDRRSRRRSLRRLAGVTIALALLAAACGDDGDSDNSSGGGDGGGTTTTAQPQSGGRLTMAMYSETRGLDPIQSSGTGVAGGTELAALYDTIVRWNPDTQEFENRTAESLTPNADHTQWTLKLRPNITFRDGAAYDANAVKLSIERHAGAQNTLNPSRSHVQIVQSMTVTDPLTISFTLKTSWPGFPYLLADEPGMLVSPKALAALGDPADAGYKERLAAFSINPVGAGAGPFELESFRPKEAIVMRKNTDYWGGDVYLDEVRFIVLAGAEATLEGLKADSIQVGLIRNPETVAEAKDAGMEGFENIVQAGDTLLINNGLQITCQAGQPAPACTGQADGAKVSPPTPGKDPKVRQAVAAALDPDAIAARAYSGKALPGSALFQSNYALDPGVDGPEYDPARAKELVAEAKQAGWDGKIRITCTNSPERKAIALAAETMLREAGMEVTTRSDIDVATQIGEVVQKKDFDLACWGLNIYPDEGGALLFEQNLSGTSATNRVGYANPEFDAALAEFKAAATPDDKKAAAKQLAEIYNEDIPVYIFGATPEFIAWQPKVHGVTPTQATMVLLDKAWIEQ